MTKKLLILLHIVLVFDSHAQSPSNPSNFRLPPEVVLKNKLSKIVDLSYKLSNGPKPANYSEIAHPFAKKYNLNNLDLYKQNPKLYNYLKNVSSFFMSVKPKFKSLYNEEELWYIYVFDNELANKLI